MKKEISKILKKEVQLPEKEIENLIEIPPSSSMGDFAFPCFALSKKLKKPPQQIAQNLKSKLKLPKGFSHIDVHGAYINFTLDRKKFAENLINKILKEKDNFGKTDLGKGKKVLIEHTSINPNASPHVGRARNALIGDSITKILKFLNFKPEVHYYINDVSKQIAMLVLAKADKLKFESMLKEYVEISNKISKSPELEKKVFELLYKFEKKDKDTTKKFKAVVNTCVDGQEKILARLGIHYDFFDYESDYIKDGEKILKKLKSKTFKDEDGRIILNLKNTKIENQMKSPVLVLTRSDGTGLYPLRDISYTIDKMKKSDKSIIILGEDQKLYFQQIKTALEFLKLKSPEVVHYSFILLSDKKNSRKMSTRKGDVVLLEDFLDEAIKKAKKEINERKTKGDPEIVGIGAVKYAILKNNNNKIINFNLDEALNFEGDTGPYLLYSYARANSILKKAEKSKKDFTIDNLKSVELDLIKKLSLFQDVVQNTHKFYNPSLIANYSYELAQIFNEFYHACPVINSSQKDFRLKLVESFKIILKNSLTLLGIETLEEM